MEWIKKYYKELVLIFLSFIITLVLADWLLHFTRYHSVFTRLAFPRYYFIADEEMGVDIAPNFKKETHSFSDFTYDVWSNELGCFDNPYNNETPYIYLTGDSFAWGFTPFEDKLGTKMESLLNTRVVKCGVPGFGTKQEFIKTSRDLIRLPKPELIIVDYFSNDALNDATFPIDTVYKGYRVPNFNKKISEGEAQQKYDFWDKYCVFSMPAHPALQRIKCWFYNNSVIYNILTKNLRPALISIFPKQILDKIGIVISVDKYGNEISPAEQAEQDYSSRASFATHLENIKNFKTLADKEKTKLLFVLIPEKGEVRSSGNDQTFQNEKIKPFLEENRIAYFDLLPVLRQYEDVKTRPLYWTIDGHLNIQGNRLAGLAISRYLLEKNIIAVPDRKEILKK